MTPPPAEVDGPWVRPGCEPFRFDGGPVGFLLQHGFTGCPGSMRPIGEWLAERGMSVAGPRLPGHGTSWEDLATTTWRDWERETERALLELSARCSTVVGLGQSMGGAIVLHLGVKHPDKLSGVATVNAYVHDAKLVLAYALRAFLKTTKGVGNDVRKPGRDEFAYTSIPLRVVPDLSRLIRTVERELPSLRVPLLLFVSDQDHVVKRRNSEIIAAKAGSQVKEIVRLHHSYHVATLDYDAELIAERVLAFGMSLARARAAGS